MTVKTFSRAIFFVVAISMSAGSTYSQDDSVTVHNSLKDGMWALQFQIGSNFTLSSFQGMVISAKRHLSTNSAIRLGVNLGLNNTESDNTEKTFEQDTLSLRTGGSDSRSSNGQSIEINGQYVCYANPDEEINFLFGGGPQFRLSRNYHEASSNPTYPPGTLYTTAMSSDDEMSWGLGLSGFAGVEWFATKSLSFHAEYGVTVAYESRTTTYTTLMLVPPPVSYHAKRISERIDKGWRLSSSGVKFGLSVYF